MSNPNIISLFPTGICVKQTAIDCEPLLSKCLELSVDEPEHGLLHGEGLSTYTNENNILEVEEFSLLKSVITSEVRTFATNIGITSKLELGRNWFNVQKEGSTIMQHNHRRSVISGAFYVLADEDASPISFCSPLMAHKMHEPSLGGSTEYDVEYFSVSARTGKLVLFPSWLEHYVGYNNSKLRVTISFNFN
jgi:uncharacterized protein (TIGR02466 family)